jgi:hypothetical protein
MNFGIYLRYTLRNPSVRIFTAAIAKQSRFPTFLFWWFVIELVWEFQLF